MSTPMREPVVEPMDIRRATVYEHTPVDYYRCGEYPRWIRPPGWHQPQTRVVAWRESGHG